MQVRIAAYTVLCAAAICVGITVDLQLDLPVCTYGAVYAFGLIVYYRMLGVLKAYHWVLLGGLGLLSLAPIWGSVDDKLSLVMIPMGVVTMCVGLFDHRDLVRSIKRARSAGITGDVNAPA
jgi:hypothetical protein